MELWNNDDQETPIEDYPGYLGLTTERSLLVRSCDLFKSSTLENIANLSMIMAESVDRSSVCLQALYRSDLAPTMT
jgi:hypothetical protein